MIDSLQLEEALVLARGVAAEAGELLRGGHDRPVAVEFKGEVDLVTEYDRRSEALLVEALGRRFPGHAVVAEEGLALEGGEGAPVWYVDPLDGTTNYAHGLAIYSVAIGLALAGEPLLGLVFAPELGWEFYGVRGGGAWFNGRRMAVSGTETLDRALVATGFPYDRRTSAQNNVPQLSRVIRRCQGIRRMGSASIDCALVAAGRLDAYWEFKLQPWDVCGGALLVAEAGGQVSDPDGSRFVPTNGRILASNGQVHRELQQILAEDPMPE